MRIFYCNIPKMISHKHKYIFIHIPKTGGTSIEKALLEAEGVHWGKEGIAGLPSKTKKKFFMNESLDSSPQHWTLDEYPKEFQENYFCFSFVRNPWAIWVSEYKSLNPTILDLDPNITFEEFIDNPRRFDYHLKPQFNFINHNINYVGRTESLNEDFQKI